MRLENHRYLPLFIGGFFGFLPKGNNLTDEGIKGGVGPAGFAFHPKESR